MTILRRVLLLSPPARPWPHEFRTIHTTPPTDPEISHEISAEPIPEEASTKRRGRPPKQKAPDALEAEPKKSRSKKSKFTDSMSATSETSVSVEATMSTNSGVETTPEEEKLKPSRRRRVSSSAFLHDIWDSGESYSFYPS